jgi:hypothetical protein
MASDNPVFSKRRRKLVWIALAVLGLMLTAFLSIEPMRWRLPLRYLFTPLDIHRTGFGDYTMCIRAELSPEEAKDFVRAMFEPKQRIALPVPMERTICPTSFWPNDFSALTMGYVAYHWPDGTVEGSTGAVYENGYIYFWSNTM